MLICIILCSDVVVACAGTTGLGRVAEISLSELKELVTVNSYAPLLLFQATQHLLRASSSPVFLYISSKSGSLIEMDKIPFPAGAYSASKAMGNALIRKLGLEEEWLIAFMIHPGFVQSRMGNENAHLLGVDEAELPLPDCASNLAHAVSWSLERGCDINGMLILCR